MNVLVYCERNSDSARDLAAALVTAGVKAKRVKALPRTTDANLILCWGQAARGAKVLNGNPLKDKLAELEKMRAANVMVPEFSRTKPRQVETNAPCNDCVCGTPHNRVTRTNDGEWLGRKRMHQSANDLRRPGTFTPDFFVKKLDIVDEFRVHVFNGQSIRLGKKQAKINAHAWIRSVETGWSIDYGDAWRGAYNRTVLTNLRNEAKKAVAALGLMFGAVDVGRTRDGQIVVFEVNTAPSLATPATAVAYAKAIKTYLDTLET